MKAIPIKFYHQVAFQSRRVIEELLENNIGSGIILSPSHLDNTITERMVMFAKQKNARIFFDPQLYADIKRFKKLATFPFYNCLKGYLKNTGDTSALYKYIKEIIKYQTHIDVAKFIVPCPYTESFSRTWVKQFEELNRSFIQQSHRHKLDILSTICINSSMLTNKDYRDELLVRCTRLKVKGFYLIIGNPSATRTITNDSELIKPLMYFILNLKRNNYEVIFGYSDVVVLLFYVLCVDGFGSWHKSRQFNIDRWKKMPPLKGRRKAKIRFFSEKLMNPIIYPDDMDHLFNKRLIKKIATASPYGSKLFSGTLPSTVPWQLPESHKHYSWICHKFAREFSKLTVKQRFNKIKARIRTSKDIYKAIKSKGIKLKQGDSYFLEQWTNALDYLKRLIED